MDGWMGGWMDEWMDGERRSGRVFSVHACVCGIFLILINLKKTTGAELRAAGSLGALPHGQGGWVINRGMMAMDHDQTRRQARTHAHTQKRDKR